MFDLNARNLLEGRSYVNGEWIDADGGGTFAVTNPSTGEEITLLTAFIDERESRREAALRQVVWSLLASSEFRFNH